MRGRCVVVEFILCSSGFVVVQYYIRSVHVVGEVAVGVISGSLNKFLTPGVVTNRLSRNVGKELTNMHCVTTLKGANIKLLNFRFMVPYIVLQYV
jgi:hypothetical protein